MFNAPDIVCNICKEPGCTVEEAATVVPALTMDEYAAKNARSMDQMKTSYELKDRMMIIQCRNADCMHTFTYTEYAPITEVMYNDISQIGPTLKVIK